MTNENSVMIDDVEYTVCKATNNSEACNSCDVYEECLENSEYGRACTSMEHGYLKIVGITGNDYSMLFKSRK